MRCSKSSIWECVHRVAGERFCVKIMKRTEYVAAQREIDYLLQAQGNDRIVRYVDTLEEKDKIYFIMEFVAAGNLLSRVAQDAPRGLPESTVQELTASLLEGVNFLHSRSIVHGDLEPSNLLLDAVSNEVKIVDFGDAVSVGASSCKASSSATTISTDGKNILYSAPEVLHTSDCYGGPSPQSDMWSVGVIVYFCLFGISPFSPSLVRVRSDIHSIRHDDSTSASIELGRIPRGRLASRIKKAEYSFPVSSPNGPNRVSRQARQFIVSLIQVDPSVRLTAEEALAHPWLCPAEVITPSALAQGDFVFSGNRQQSSLRRFLFRFKSHGTFVDDGESSGAAMTRPSYSSGGSASRRSIVSNALQRVFCVSRRFPSRSHGENDVGAEIVDFIDHLPPDATTTNTASYE
jgi:ser/thr/tyr protein kinase RAD53